MFRVKFPTGAKLTSGSKLLFRFKRFIFDKSRAMEQGLFNDSIGDPPDTRDNSVHSKVVDNGTNAKKSEVAKAPKQIEALRDIVLTPGDTVEVKTVNNCITSIAMNHGIHTRVGQVESIKSESKTDRIGIVTGLYRMEENVRDFENSVVRFQDNEGIILGHVIGPFGKLGKCKVKLINEIDVSVGTQVVVISTTSI